MASFLVRALNLDQASPAGFVDVDPGGVHAPSIDALAAAGVTTGCGAAPLRYCPDEFVTRAQMASFLVRALNLDQASPDLGVIVQEAERLGTRLRPPMGEVVARAARERSEGERE